MSLPCKTVVVLGDPKVGKTMFSRFLLQQSSSSKELLQLTDTYEPTKYYQLCIVGLQIIKGFSIYLQLWDTPGQPQLHTSNEIYHKNALYLIIIDLERKDSFDSIMKWRKRTHLLIQDIEGLIKKDKNSPNYDCIIFGNKSINQTQEWVKAEQLKNMMKDWKGKNTFKELCLRENPTGARKDLRDILIEREILNQPQFKSALGPSKSVPEQVESKSSCVIM